MVSYNVVVLPSQEITSTSASLTANKAYIANSSSPTTLTLPSTASFGDAIKIIGKGSGLWKIGQNVGQTIYFGNYSSTVGITGYLAATSARDCVYLFCISANEWQVDNAVGVLNIV